MARNKKMFALKTIHDGTDWAIVHADADDIAQGFAMTHAQAEKLGNEQISRQRGARLYDYASADSRPPSWAAARTPSGIVAGALAQGCPRAVVAQAVVGEALAVARVTDDRELLGLFTFAMTGAGWDMSRLEVFLRAVRPGLSMPPDQPGGAPPRVVGALIAAVQISKGTGRKITNDEATRIDNLYLALAFARSSRVPGLRGRAPKDFLPEVALSEVNHNIQRSIEQSGWGQKKSSR